MKMSQPLLAYQSSIDLDSTLNEAKLEAKPARKTRTTKASPKGPIKKKAECQICCDLVTTLIPCFKCDLQICSTCLKQTILDSQLEPSCCNCKLKFPMTFLISNLGRTWMNSTYRAKRKVDLIAEVKGDRAFYLGQIQADKIQATLREVKTFKRVLAEHLFKEIGRASLETAQAKALKAKIRELANIPTDQSVNRLLSIDPSEAEEVFRKFKNNNTYFTDWSFYNLKYLVRYEVHLQNQCTLKEREAFVQTCPNANCKGMLSQKYKCSTCEVTFCPRCLKPKMKDHECDQDLVSTIDLIKATSKKCPKCSERIDKDSGCDQMWCPTCKVAFSWRTGKIENGYIHNPHYFEYMRRTGQDIARAPGDQADPCQGLHEYAFAELMTLKDYFTNLRQAQFLYHELCARMDIVQRPVSISKVSKVYYQNENKDSEAKLGTQLIKFDTIRFKNAELFQIYETAKLALIDIIHNLLHDQTRDKALETTIAVSNLVEYINLTLANFCKLTKLTVKGFSY